MPINLIIHDTTHVAKILVDTVRASSKDSMDLLTKIDSFYNNSWNKLLLGVTMSFTIIGIFVPLLIQWYQKKELKLSEEKLKKEIKDEIDNALKQMQTDFDENNKTQLRQLRSEIKALGHHLQAVVFRENKNYSNAYIEYIKAFRSHLDANDKANAVSSILGLKSCLKRSSKKEIDDAIEKDLKSNFYRVFEVLEKIKTNLNFEVEIAELKDIYESLSHPPA